MSRETDWSLAALLLTNPDFHTVFSITVLSESAKVVSS